MNSKYGFLKYIVCDVFYGSKFTKPINGDDFRLFLKYMTVFIIASSLVTGIMLIFDYPNGITKVLNSDVSIIALIEVFTFVMFLIGGISKPAIERKRLRVKGYCVTEDFYTMFSVFPACIAIMSGGIMRVTSLKTGLIWFAVSVSLSIYISVVIYEKSINTTYSDVELDTLVKLPIVREETSGHRYYKSEEIYRELVEETFKQKEDDIEEKKQYYISQLS